EDSWQPLTCQFRCLGKRPSVTPDVNSVLANCRVCERVGNGVAGGEDDRYRAPALDKGLDIIELLAGTAEGLSQAEIAKALDRTPNEIYRMLDRLVRRAYVRRTPGDRYEITLKLF